LYDANTAAPNKGLYSHTAIYSPAVPVFRGDDSKLLDEPFNVAFISCPAVNAGVASRGNREPRAKPATGADGKEVAPAPAKSDKDKEAAKVEAKAAIAATMIERIDRILSIALLNGHSHIVLGAYGCGVFRNNANDVASYFKQLLTGKGKYAGQFEQIVFAVVEDRNNTPNAAKTAAATDSKDAKSAPAKGAAAAASSPAAAAGPGAAAGKAAVPDKPRESKLGMFIEKFKDVLTAPPPVLAAPAPVAAATAAAVTSPAAAASAAAKK